MENVKESSPIIKKMELCIDSERIIQSWQQEDMDELTSAVPQLIHVQEMGWQW